MSERFMFCGVSYEVTARLSADGTKRLLSFKPVGRGETLAHAPAVFASYQRSQSRAKDWPRSDRYEPGESSGGGCLFQKKSA